jgi:hypothetical protein
MLLIGHNSPQLSEIIRRQESARLYWLGGLVGRVESWSMKYGTGSES